MTPEPMSDERIVEIGRCFLQLGFIPDSVGQELLDEVVRTRDIPPDVLAAMERFRGNEFGKGSWPYEGALYDVITLAAWAVSHFGKDG